MDSTIQHGISPSDSISILLCIAHNTLQNVYLHYSISTEKMSIGFADFIQFHQKHQKQNTTTSKTTIQNKNSYFSAVKDTNFMHFLGLYMMNHLFTLSYKFTDIPRSIRLCNLGSMLNELLKLCRIK